jgi:general L-amino acid transport system substrate-binding protein
MEFYKRMLRDVRAAPERWPTLDFTLGTITEYMVPPGSWQYFIDEIARYLVTELGIADDSALRTILRVQHALLPARDREYPVTLELEHDVAAWHDAMMAAKHTGAKQTWEAEVPPLRSFGPTTFYDGQGVMVPVASGAKTLKDLDGKPICVESGTTTELNLADRMREQGIAYTPLKFQTGDQTYAAYLGGRCVAVTSDRSQLAAKRSSFPKPDEHILLPEVMSKEPLTPASVNGDPAWADAMRWTVFALFQAEELGITKANVAAKVAEAKANTNQADLRRFLGVEGDFGKQLGLPADFVPKTIAAVGNYGEIFERNVGSGSPLKLERAENRLWTQGGLIYSPPFR